MIRKNDSVPDFLCIMPQPEYLYIHFTQIYFKLQQFYRIFLVFLYKNFWKNPVWKNETTKLNID